MSAEEKAIWMHVWAIVFARLLETRIDPRSAGRGATVAAEDAILVLRKEGGVPA